MTVVAMNLLVDLVVFGKFTLFIIFEFLVFVDTLLGCLGSLIVVSALVDEMIVAGFTLPVVGLSVADIGSRFFGDFFALEKAYLSLPKMMNDLVVLGLGIRLSYGHSRKDDGA